MREFRQTGGMKNFFRGENEFMNMTVMLLALDWADFQGILIGVVLAIIIPAMVIAAIRRGRDVKRADEFTHDHVEAALHSKNLKDTKVERQKGEKK